MDNPVRYSVIIPTYNEEAFLPHLLESLITQSEQSFDVCVVDGKSSDKTVRIAKSFQAKLPGLRVIESQVAGLPLQRNIGARATKGDVLVFIDADSILLPYFFDRITEFMEKNNPALFTTWFRPDTESNADAMVTLLLNLVIEGSIRFHRPVAPGPLTCVKRTIYDKVGGYDDSLKWGEDYDFTKRVCKMGNQLSILRETLYIYSLRRFRHERKIKLAQMYAKAIFSVLFTNQTPRYIPGYIMGGHLYGKKAKQVGNATLRSFEARLRNLLRELFE